MKLNSLKVSYHPLIFSMQAQKVCSACLTSDSKCELNQMSLQRDTHYLLIRSILCDLAGFELGFSLMHDEIGQSCVVANV